MTGTKTPREEKWIEMGRDAGLGEPRDVIPTLTLDALAVEIHAAMERAEQKWKGALGEAILAGSLLMEAKSRLKHGQYEDWVAAKFPKAERTARLYKRLAENAATVADLPSIKAAVAALAEPKAEVIEAPDPDAQASNVVPLRAAKTKTAKPKPKPKTKRPKPAKAKSPPGHAPFYVLGANLEQAHRAAARLLHEWPDGAQAEGEMGGRTVVYLDMLTEIEAALLRVVGQDRPEPEAPTPGQEVADDAGSDLRTEALRWIAQGRLVRQLLDAGAAIHLRPTAGDRQDRAALLRDADLMATIGRRLEEAIGDLPEEPIRGQMSLTGEEVTS